MAFAKTFTAITAIFGISACAHIDWSIVKPVSPAYGVIEYANSYVSKACLPDDARLTGYWFSQVTKDMALEQVKGLPDTPLLSKDDHHYILDSFKKGDQHCSVAYVPKEPRRILLELNKSEVRF